MTFGGNKSMNMTITMNCSPIPWVNKVKYLELDGQGRARREAARRRKSEWKVNLGNGISSRSNAANE